MRPGSYYTDPFTDLLFNALLGITFLFLIAIMFMNPIAKAGNVRLLMVKSCPISIKMQDGYTLTVMIKEISLIQ
jgi:hypothetical protein